MAKSIKRESLNKLKKIISNMGNEEITHAKRVKLFSQLICDQIVEKELIADVDKKKKELNLIPQAAYFHDLGKSAIPRDYYHIQDIRNEAGKDVYRTHVEEGFRIFDETVDLLEMNDKDIEEMSMINFAILEHHERWDGLGFPNKLEGEEISLTGRVTAVADALDNYLMKTRDKERVQLEFAIDRIVTHKLTRFDPMVVNALIFAKENIEDKLYLLENGSLSDVQMDEIDKNKPMELMFRPIFNTLTRQISSYKVTLKLYDKTYGNMYSAVYRAIEEKYDLSREIMEQEFTEIGKAYQNFQKRGVAFEKIYVDVSAKYLSKKYSAESLLAILDKYGVNPTKIVFEITESLLADIRIKMLDNIQILRQRGIGIALYDFGSEYSTLTKLSDFHVTEIVLARDFASQVVYDPQMREIVRSIVDLAKKLKLDIVANGITTKAEEQVMKELGVRFMEGLFYGGYKKERYVRGDSDLKMGGAYGRQL